MTSSVAPPTFHSSHLASILADVGWCTYKEPVGQDRVHTIYAGPTEKLSLGERYIVLPRAENPFNPESVDAAVEALSPYVGLARINTRVLGDPASLRAFTLYGDYVALECPRGKPWTYVDYAAFEEACRNLVRPGLHEPTLAEMGF